MIDMEKLSIAVVLWGQPQYITFVSGVLSIYAICGSKDDIELDHFRLTARDK